MGIGPPPSGRDTSRKQGTTSLGRAAPPSSPPAGTHVEVRGAWECLQERLAGQGDLQDGARPGPILSGLDSYVDKFKNNKGRRTGNPVRGLRAAEHGRRCAGLDEEVGLRRQQGGVGWRTGSGECGWKQHRLGRKPGHRLCFQEKELPCHPSEPLGEEAAG